MNIQRVAKYIASFVGIALALAISVMPAFASDDGIYNPADYEVGSPKVDSSTGLITYSYEFGVTPRMNVYYDDVFDTYVSGLKSSVTADPSAGVTKVGLRVFPLGVYAGANSPWPADKGVIDVRDFKSYSQFTLSATFDISWTFIYLPGGTSEMRSFWQVYCYDANGWYTGTIRSDTSSRTFTFESSGTTGMSYTAGGVIELPENTAYILPSCLMNLYTPSLPESTYFTMQAKNLKLDFSIDSVLENTLTMQVIKDQLGDISSGIGDLNNKFDDVLSGTPEQNQQAQDSANNVGNQVQDFESIMDELQEYEEIELQWGVEYLSNFLTSNAYLWVKDLISPLLNWTSFITILLTILALSNLSLILFGR